MTVQRMSDAIGNGLGTVEHVLEATPATLADVDAKLDAFIAQALPILERTNAALDQFEAIATAMSESPVGKMMMKRMKGDEG